MDDLFPQMNALEILQTYARPLCIESIIDPMIYHFLSLESAVEAYGVDALDLPLDLFQIFEQIRSSSNLWESTQNFKREAELKAKTK